MNTDVMMKVFNEYSAAVDQLYEFTEAYDLTASEVLSGKDAFEQGAEAFDEYCESLGLSEEAKNELAALAEGLDEFGVKAFESAQKARTWGDVVDSVKDAVSTAWMHTFELIIGNSEEATALFTDMANELYDVFAEPINRMNETLEGGLGIQQYFEDMGWMSGRELLVESFWNVWNGLLDTLSLVKEAWQEIFPATTAERLQETIVKIFEFTKKLTLSDETADKLSRTLKGVFSVLDLVKSSIGSVVSGVLPVLTRVLGTVINKILDLTSKWGDWITEFNKTLHENGTFQKISETITNFLNNVIDKGSKVVSTILPILQKVVSFVKEKFVLPGWELFHTILKRIHERLSGVHEAAEKAIGGIGAVFSKVGAALENSGFFNVLSKIWEVIKQIGSGVAKVFGSVFSSLLDKLSHADFKGILDIFNSLISGGIGIGIGKFLKSLSDGIGDLTSFTESVTGVLNGVKDCLKAFTEEIKSKALKNIAIAVALLAGSLLVLSLIDSDKLAGALGAITVLFIELVGAMTAFSKLTDDKKMVKGAGTMIAMALAVLILASALKKLGDLDMKQLGTGLLGVAALSAIMVIVAKTLSSDSKKIMKGAASMIIFAKAIQILASVCKDMSSMSWEEMAKGLVAVGVLLAEVDIFLNTAKFSGGKAITTATGIVILSAALKILVSVCKDFAAMSLESLGKGLGSIAALLLSLAVFTRISGNAKHVLSTGIALIAIAGAMKIFVGVIRDFGNMSLETIGKGLGVFAGALLIVVVAVNAIHLLIRQPRLQMQTRGALIPQQKQKGSMSGEELLPLMATAQLRLGTLRCLPETLGLPGQAVSELLLRS